jgi:hypothetical protein
MISNCRNERCANSKQTYCGFQMRESEARTTEETAGHGDRARSLSSPYAAVLSVAHPPAHSIEIRRSLPSPYLRRTEPGFLPGLVSKVVSLIVRATLLSVNPGPPRSLRRPKSHDHRRAAFLARSRHTIKHIMEKFGANDRMQVVAIAGCREIIQRWASQSLSRRRLE